MEENKTKTATEQILEDIKAMSRSNFAAYVAIKNPDGSKSYVYEVKDNGFGVGVSASNDLKKYKPLAFDDMKDAVKLLINFLVRDIKATIVIAKDGEGL